MTRLVARNIGEEYTHVICTYVILTPVFCVIVYYYDIVNY